MRTRWLYLVCFMLLLPAGLALSSSHTFTIVYPEDANVLPVEARQAMEDALDNWVGYPEDSEVFYMLHLHWKETWAIATMIPEYGFQHHRTEAHSDEDHTVEIIQPIDLLFNIVLVQKDGIWQAAVEMDSSARILAENISDRQLSQEAKDILFSPPEVPRSLSPMLQEYNNYKMPWPSGKPWRRTRSGLGWHSSNNRALDFDILAPDTNSDILASAPGTVVHICGMPSAAYNEQYYVVVETDGTSERLGYLHLDGAVVRQLNIHVGMHLDQGQVIGRMRYADNGGVSGTCGTSYGTHVHLLFPSKPFIIDGYSFTSNYTYSGINLYSTQGSIDTEPPNTQIIGGPTGWTAGGFTINWTGSDNSTPISNLQFRYRLNGIGNWTSWGSITSKTYASNAVPHGWHVFEVQARDGVGNVDPTPATRSFGVDRRPPASPSISVSGAGCDIAQNSIWQNTCRDVSFTWSASDQGSGVQGYNYYWGNISNGLPTIGTTSASFDPGPIASPDGFAKQYFNINTVDQVNLTSGLATFGLWYDGALPTVNFAINGGASTTTQINVTLDVNASDIGSGVKWISVSNDGVNWSDWINYTAQVPWILPPISNTTHTVYVQVADEAGNTSAIATDSIDLLLYPPPPHSANYQLCHSVVASAGSHSGSSSNYRQVMSIGETIITRPGGMSSSNYEIQFGFLSHTSTCPPVTNPLLNKVSVGMSNPDASLSTPEQAVPRSIGSPTFGVVINSDNSYTNDLNVTLELLASNMLEMRIANEPTFNGISWQPYQAIEPWMISGNANNPLPSIVYVEYRDASGNVYGPFIDEITYDSSSPESMIGILGNDEDPTIMIYMDSWDSNSGVSLVGISELPDMTGATWQVYTETIEYSVTTNTVYVQFQDEAGNRSTVYVLGLLEDTFLPLLRRD